MTYKEKLVRALAVGYVVKDGRVFTPTGKELSVTLDTNGYPRVFLWLDGRNFNVQVHRLIALLKFGALALKAGIETRHLDDNSINNAWDNIAIGTHLQNSLDKPKEKRIKVAKYAASFVRKLTYKQANMLRADRDSGMLYKDLMSKYGVGKSTVSDIVNNKIYCSVL